MHNTTMETQHIISPYDNIASEYYNTSHKTCRFFDSISLEALKPLKGMIPSKGLILDVGCGRGRCNEFLSIDTNRVIQLDNSIQMLNIEDRENSLLRIHHDAEELPFLDKTFSTITSFLCDAFFGLDFLSETHRTLNDKGVFLATIPSHEWGTSLRNGRGTNISETTFETANGNKVTVPSNIFPYDQILDMLTLSGFRTNNIKIQTLKPLSQLGITKHIYDAANTRGCAFQDLEILYLITATKV